MIQIVIGKDPKQNHVRACYLAKTGTCADISRQGEKYHISVSDYYEHDINFIEKTINHIYEERFDKIPNNVAIHFT